MAKWRRHVASGTTTLLVAVLGLLGTAVEAAAAPEGLVAFGDDSYCLVGMENVHPSGADASVAVNVDCHPPAAPRGIIKVEEVVVETSIDFSEVGNASLFGLTIGTCEPSVKQNINRGQFTCHLPARGPGFYTGTASVSVTYLGETDDTEVSRMNELNNWIV